MISSTASIAEGSSLMLHDIPTGKGRKFKFRGYDNHKKGARTLFGYCHGDFMVGKVYPAIDIDTNYVNGASDAQFTDDTGAPVWEELVYFDEVTDE